MTVSSFKRSASEIDQQFQMLIDGKWVSSVSEEYFSCEDPYVEEKWGQIPLANAEDVELAVNAAQRNFESGAWSQMLASQRADLLRKLADLIEENAEALAYQQIRENGKLIAEMLPSMSVISNACRYFAHAAETLTGMTMPDPYPNVKAHTVREPIGVVAIITPWNSPLLLLAWKLFPALAAGNTVVIKPSEITPTSTLLLGKLIEQAGFPAGVVNIITGYGDPAGTALVSHKNVAKISFTGSSATGSKIAHAAADRHASTTFELGGKSPNIVFADADISNAVNGVMSGIFAATGQSCMAGSRVLVQDEVYDQVAELLAERGSKMIAGDPLDHASQIGPTASRLQLEKILSYFEIAKQEGLNLLCGGKRMDRPGFFIEPTVFSEMTNQSQLAQEEIFGPVISLLRFKDEDEALSIANDTLYGLAAGVWTENVRLAHRMASKLRAGTVWINNYRMVSYTVPFGGFKQSGMGRELGPDALKEFTEVKSVWIDTGNQINFETG